MLSRISLGSLEDENLIEMLENGQKGSQGQVCAKAVLSLFRSSFTKRWVHEVEQVWIKFFSCQFLGNPSPWRFRLWSLEAEKMIKVLENGQEGGRESEDWMNKDGLNWMNITIGSNDYKLNWMNRETELNEYRNQIEPI